jgi:hypothetical protein
MLHLGNAGDAAPSADILIFWLATYIVSALWLVISS